MAEEKPKTLQVTVDDLDAEESQAKLLSPRQANTTKFILKRDTSKPRDVYTWMEITLQDISVTTQTFKVSAEVYTFWQDFQLLHNFRKFGKDPSVDGFTLEEDDTPIKLSEVFENKTDFSFVVDPEFTYDKQTGRCVFYYGKSPFLFLFLFFFFGIFSRHKA